MLDRQRDREIELRREIEWERERQARRQRAREAPAARQADEPLKISSRPIGLSARVAPGAGMVTPPVRSRLQPPAPPPRYRQPAGRAVSTERATAILAAGTFASRVTGFLRVLAIGYVLGVGSLSDAFNYANGIPNIAYDLLLGGILSATLIPVFVEQLQSDDREGCSRALSAILTSILVALAAISALLWLLAPALIRFYLLLNHASTAAPERALATKLLHYFAPQVFFLGAIVVTTALLNARRQFTAAAVSPVVNNLIAIAALLVTKVVASHTLTNKSASPTATLQRFGHDQKAVLILGLGTTAGYLIQLLVQLPATRRLGFGFRLIWAPSHPAVRKVVRLSAWLFGVVLANQVSLAVVMVLAGRTAGGITAYQFSYQFFQLPYALVAVSIASAIMPNLAERWTSRDTAGFEAQLVTGLRVSLALLIPAGVAYAAVAQPFIQLAIHHGRVTASGAHLVSSSLALFAAGLPGFSAFFILMRAYQAMQQTRVMFWIYLLENGMTVVAALILEPLIGVPGLALAWVAPYTIASVVAVVDLRRRVGPLGGGLTVRRLVRVAVASGLAGLVVVALGLPFPAGSGTAVVVARLILQLGAGTLTYLWLARLLRINELRRVVRMLRRLTGP
jgi:putative peptidoglycan lipid II flippase